MRQYRLITAADSSFLGLGVIRGYAMEDDVWVEYSPELILEIIMEELGYYEPDFHEFCSLYLHGDYSGVSLAVDYTPDSISDESVDRIQEWLFKNVWCEPHVKMIHKQHCWGSKWNWNKGLEFTNQRIRDEN